jgi:pimeloyl-ACP methyl ester carboxylesterase
LLADPASDGGDPADAAGVHITSAVVTSDFRDQPPTAAEQAYLDARDVYDAGDQGYSEIMCTRPDTIAAALTDSPAGLAAWIIDKYREWSDCRSDLESRWDKDTLLTVATLYWAVPAAVTLSNEPAYATYPRSLAERVFADLRHWSTPDRGGHFMAHEEPGQVASELRAFFRPLRLAG